MAPPCNQSPNSTPTPRPRSWLGPLILILGLLPTVATAWQALTVDDAVAGGRPRSARQKILAKIPRDPSVLINVTYRDMPSSPDILNLGKRSTKALERCLSDNVDANVRSLCAVVLQALGDRRALPTLHAALEDWEVDVRWQVVRALGAIPDPSSVEPLLKLFARKDEESHVRSAILHALGSISDQRVVRMLRGLLRKKADENVEDFRPQAFDALWHNRHLMGRPTLIGDTLNALRSDNDSLVQSATLAAAELRSPRLVTALIPLMEHPWAEVRNKAVYALGRIGDKKATKALLARLPKVRESRMLNNIAFALERLDKQAFYTSIKQVIEHKQAIIRLNAAFVLGDVKHPEGLPMLQAALDDASDFVRTSAIVAVGKLGTNAAQTKAAIAALEPFVSHPNLSVRQEAIYAIHALTQGGRVDLIHDELYSKVDRRKHRAIIERAALALGEAGDPRVHDYLVNCLLRRSCTVRTVGPYLRKQGRPGAKGRVLLAWARRNTGLSELVAQLKPPGTLPVASSALREDWAYPRSEVTFASLRILGSAGNSSVTSLLERRANTRYTWARIEGRVALARLGKADASTRLLAEMDTLPAAWFPRFARALSRVQEPAVQSQLDPGLEKKQSDKDVHVALAAAAIRLSWDPDKAVFRFLDALASPSSHERDLAEHYLSRNKDQKVTWLLRRALAREGRIHTRDRLRALLDERG